MTQICICNVYINEIGIHVKIYIYIERGNERHAYEDIRQEDSRMISVPVRTNCDSHLVHGFVCILDISLSDLSALPPRQSIPTSKLYLRSASSTTSRINKRNMWDGKTNPQ